MRGEGDKKKVKKSKNKTQPFPVNYSKEYKILIKGQKVAYYTFKQLLQSQPIGLSFQKGSTRGGKDWERILMCV